MKIISKVFVILTLSLFMSCQTNFNKAELPQELLSLASIIENDGSNKRIEQWLESNYYGPIIDKGSVTFLYFSNKLHTNTRVSIVANIGLKERDSYLKRVKNSNLFYKTFKIESVDGLKYQFLIHNDMNKKVKSLDPYNKNIVYERRIKNIIREPQSSSTTIQIVNNLKFKSPNLSRNIYVCLPPGYFNSGERHYPVLYMHDGQQIFDSNLSNHGGWKVDSTLEKLVNDGAIEPIIIVGIENTRNRNEEYIGYSAYYGFKDRDEEFVMRVQEYSKGYEDFVVNTLKPFIDSHYRTLPNRENTSIAGSSFGAGASLYIGFRNNKTFGKVGAFSGGNFSNDNTNYPIINNFSVYPYIINMIIPGVEDMKVYIDCGGQDIDNIFLPRTVSMYNALIRQGYVEGRNLYYQIDENAGHNEREWAKRFPDFLKFMFSK